MKIQTVAIIYTLIIIPIFIVISFSLTTYAKLTNVRAEYDMKILGATQDAIKAFEINTGDEEFSKVPDLLSSIVEASFNVFRDSLATKMGMSNASKPIIDQYFPLGIFTLYDGMYISTPSNERSVLRNSFTGQAEHVDSPGISYSGIDKNGNITGISYDENVQETENNNAAIGSRSAPKPLVKPGVKPVIFEKNETGQYTTDYLDKNIKEKQKHILKTYIPYSAKYALESGDYIDVNYSIDNYISVTGKKGNATFCKSGYLLNLDKDIKVIANGPSYFNGLLDGSGNVKYGNDEVIDRYFDKLRENKEAFTLKIVGEQIPIYNYNEKEYIKNPINNQNNEITISINSSDYSNNTAGREEYITQQISAIKYYMKAKLFTDWVKSNFSNLTVDKLILDVPSLSKVYRDDEGIFEETKKNLAGQKIFEGDPLDPNSQFHVIRKSILKSQIEYHILLATINYNKQKYTHTTEYKFPYIRLTDWEKILNNISFTMFAEGFINSDFAYNNYFTATSTNNDFNINPKSLVYVRRNEFNDATNSYYSVFADRFTKNQNELNRYKYIGLKRMKFDYDAVFNKKTHTYEYDHKNIADISTIFSDNEKAQLNETQLYLTQVALASQKEQQYKFSKAVKDSTVIYVEGNTSTIPAGIGGPNDTIKSIAVTVGFKGVNNNNNNNAFGYTSKVKELEMTLNGLTYKFPMRINSGNSKDVKKIYNGLDLVGTGRKAPPNNSNNKFSSSNNFSLRVPPEMEVKQVKFEKY